MHAHIQTEKMDRTARKRWISKNMPLAWIVCNKERRRKINGGLLVWNKNRRKKKEVDRRTPFDCVEINID